MNLSNVPPHPMMARPIPGPSMGFMAQPVIQQPRQASYYSLAQGGRVKRMAISQIVMGGILFIFGLATCILESVLKHDNDGQLYSFNGTIGAGMWMSAMFFIPGIIGVVASRKNTMGGISGCIVMNIIASIFSVSLIGMSAASVAINNRYYHCKYNSYSAPLCVNVPQAAGLKTMDAISLIMAIAQLGITIAISAICCSAVCCRPFASPNQNMIVYQYGGVPQQLANLYPATVGPAISYSGGIGRMQQNYGPPQGMVNSGFSGQQAYPSAPSYSQEVSPPPAGVHGEPPVGYNQKPPPYQA